MGRPERIFVIDPMCSWCWGFHPVIETLRKKYSDQYHFSLVVGGLRTKGAMIWNSRTKQDLQATWQGVAAHTKQHFTDRLFRLKNFEYDTYPACKAVVTVRELFGDTASFEYLSKIQKAFYVEGRDITKAETLSSFLALDEQEAFMKFFHSNRAEVLLQHDFSKARSMGANAFPSVVKIDSDGHMMCKKGYQTAEEILVT
ncbi:MAG: DsbA family protein [Campylobacterota bacterium]